MESSGCLYTDSMLNFWAVAAQHTNSDFVAAVSHQIHYSWCDIRKVLTT